MNANEITLRALRSNAGLEKWYREKLQALIKAMAESMLLHIKAAYPEDAQIGFARDSDPIVELTRAMNKWGRRWTRNLNDASDEIAKMFAKRSRRNLDTAFMAALKDAGFTVKFRPTAGMVQAYRAVVSENVNLIRSIPQKFLTDVQSQVWQSVMKGAKQSQLAQGIREKYDLSWRRAALIARDQNNKAKAVMEEARRSELGIDEAIWMHSGGGKEPRPEHVKWGAQKKRYKIREGMYSSVDGAYVWPGTAINCFPGDTLVNLSEQPLALWRSTFNGPMIYIHTERGLLKGTPNHPILTRRGWIALGQLDGGDEIACMGERERRMVYHNKDERITSFKNLFESYACVFAQTRRSSSGFNFYGDIPNSDVDEIIPTRILSLNFESAGIEHIRQFDFSYTYNSSLLSVLGIKSGIAHTLSSCFDQDRPTSSDRRALHALTHGAATRTHDATGDQDISNGAGAITRSSKLLSDGGGSESLSIKGNDLVSSCVPINSETRSHSTSAQFQTQLVRIATDYGGGFNEGSAIAHEFCRLVDKEIRYFSGHVYTMETSDGYYSVSNARILAKNCRCTSRSIIPGLSR